MVTRLKDNKNYLEYIRKKMADNLPDWKEKGAAYEGEINNIL